MPDAAPKPLTMTIRGVELPRVGLGTWEVTGPDCVEAVRDALEIGYRHIDTAAAYGNEEEVGRALAESEVDRSEVWLTSKVWMEDTEPGRLRDSAEESLRKLGTDRLDLLLIHWPGDPEHFDASLEELAALREEGRIRELGVSNYPPGQLRRAAEVAPVFADQVEMHPYFGQADLLELAAELDLLIEAYAPIGTGRVLKDETLNEIAEAHGKGPAQVALRWLLLREARLRPPPLDRPRPPGRELRPRLRAERRGTPADRRALGAGRALLQPELRPGLARLTRWRGPQPGCARRPSAVPGACTEPAAP